MKPKPLYMERTEIAAEKTAGEITSLLVTAGACHIAMDYDEGGKITGLHFMLIVNSLPFPFKLPVRTKALQRIFADRRRRTMGSRAHEFEAADREQAERVAWRQLLRWIQAQFAMVDAGMVETREVFSPYLLDPSGKTLFEFLDQTRFKALPPGDPVCQ